MVRQTEKWAEIIKTFEWSNTLVRWLWTSDLISVGLSFPSVKWEQWVKFRELGLQLILAAVVVVYAADFESRFSKHPNPTLNIRISSISSPKHYAACICFCSKLQAGASTSRLGMNKEWHWGEDSWSLSRVWMCSEFTWWWASLPWVYTDIFGWLLALAQVLSVREATVMPREARQTSAYQDVKGRCRPFTPGIAKSKVSIGVSR